MKALLQVTCIVGAICIVGGIAFAGTLYQFGANTPGAAAPDAMPQETVSGEMPGALAGALAFATAVPKAFAEADTAPAAEPAAKPGPVQPGPVQPGPVQEAASEPTPMAQVEVARADPIETGSVDTKSVDTKSVDIGRHDAAQPVPGPGDSSVDAARSLPVTPSSATQDFRYLIYYVWSELPPAEKPAAIVLRAFKDIPVGTPIEEIKRASDAFGLDFNFMKAVAKIESGFDPKQRTGSYIGLFQLSKYEFEKFGSGQILNPRDNAVAAAYKVITEGILFEWVTHRTPTLSDLYLIHQQGWEGAAEHINQPDRIAWKSMCATGEGREKGEKWCKRAIWGNTLPAVKKVWKSVDDMTSAAFVGMWHQRLADFYSKYMTAATAAAERASP